MKNIPETPVLGVDLLEKLVLGMSAVLCGLFTACLGLQECECLSLVSTTEPLPGGAWACLFCACLLHHPVPTTVSGTQRGHTAA